MKDKKYIPLQNSLPKPVKVTPLNPPKGIPSFNTSPPKDLKSQSLSTIKKSPDQLLTKTDRVVIKH